jgi:hypothetical protein
MLLIELKKSLLTSLPLKLPLKTLRRRPRPQLSLFQEVKRKKRRKKSSKKPTSRPLPSLMSQSLQPQHQPLLLLLPQLESLRSQQFQHQRKRQKNQNQMRNQRQLSHQHQPSKSRSRRRTMTMMTMMMSQLIHSQLKFQEARKKLLTKSLSSLRKPTKRELIWLKLRKLSLSNLRQSEAASRSIKNKSPRSRLRSLL